MQNIDKATAIEIKWSEQLRPNDLKMLKQFSNSSRTPHSIILTKLPTSGQIGHITSLPVYEFLYDYLPLE